MSQEQTPTQTEQLMPGIAELTPQTAQPVSQELAQVIQFPMDRLSSTTSADDADPHGTDRGHIDYEISKANIANSIQATQQATRDEKARQADLQDWNKEPDRAAEIRSDLAWAKVDALHQPAGTVQNQQIGHEVLRVIQG